MKVVNMHEAKTTLSQLVEQVENGEEVVLARAGKPVARLVAIYPAEPRQLGPWKGQVRMTADFDDELPTQELDAWSRPA